MRRYPHVQCMRLSLDREIVDGKAVRVPVVRIAIRYRQDRSLPKWRQLGYDDWEDYNDHKFNTEEANKRYNLVPGRHR